MRRHIWSCNDCYSEQAQQRWQVIAKSGAAATSEFGKAYDDEMFDEGNVFV